MTTIVQIAKTGTPGRVLVKNQSITIFSYIDMDDRVLKMLGEKPHVYAKAKMSKSGVLTILDMVKNQGWP
jgi:hypothetical protein